MPGLEIVLLDRKEGLTSVLWFLCALRTEAPAPALTLRECTHQQGTPYEHTSYPVSFLHVIVS